MWYTSGCPRAAACRARNRKRAPCRTSSPTRAENRRRCGGVRIRREPGNVQPQQHAALGARKTLRLVKLVGEGEDRRELLRPGNAGIFVDDGSGHRVPRVPVVARANHLAEFRPVEKRRRRGVRPDESLAVVLHERQQVSFLMRVKRHVTMTRKKNRIDVCSGWAHRSQASHSVINGCFEMC